MAKAGAMICRRSPHVVFYWRKSQFVAHNYATGAVVAAHPLTCDVLDFFDDWRPSDAFLAAHPAAARTALRGLLDRLVQSTLLQRSSDRIADAERAMDAWGPWNPAAGFFHASTRDLPFVDMNTQVRTLRAKARRAPMPRATKRYASARRIPLPPRAREGEFADVLLARRTWRRFDAAPIDLESFGTLLSLTARVQRWADAAGEGKVPLKTSPSGGARHAVEVYTLALRIRGLRAGMYHYAADAHFLELLDSDATRGRIARYLPRQPWYRGAAAIVFFTAVFEREVWRYGYARAYRALLIEAGHLCQTFCLTATWLGLAPFCTMALADSAIERDLRVDGIGESVLYAAGIGSRPVGASAPAGARAGRAHGLTRAEVEAFPGRIVSRRRS